jgi:hypothetical protein
MTPITFSRWFSLNHRPTGPVLPTGARREKKASNSIRRADAFATSWRRSPFARECCRAPRRPRYRSRPTFGKAEGRRMTQPHASVLGAFPKGEDGTEAHHPVPSMRTAIVPMEWDRRCSPIGAGSGCRQGGFPPRCRSRGSCPGERSGTNLLPGEIGRSGQNFRTSVNAATSKNRSGTREGPASRRTAEILLKDHDEHEEQNGEEGLQDTAVR